MYKYAITREGVEPAYRWISWHFLPWDLKGIMSPCCLLIGHYLHHMTLCTPVAIVKRRYGIHLFQAAALTLEFNGS